MSMRNLTWAILSALISWLAIRCAAQLNETERAQLPCWLRRWLSASLENYIPTPKCGKRSYLTTTIPYAEHGGDRTAEGGLPSIEPSPEAWLGNAAQDCLPLRCPRCLYGCGPMAESVYWRHWKRQDFQR